MNLSISGRLRKKTKKSCVPAIWAENGNYYKALLQLNTGTGNTKKFSCYSGRGRETPETLPAVREREFKAFLLGTIQEREFTLMPDPLSSSFILFHLLSSYFVLFHPLSSPFILFHPLSSSFILFHHLSSSVILFHRLSSSVFLSHPLSSSFALFHQSVYYSTSVAHIFVLVCLLDMSQWGNRVAWRPWHCLSGKGHGKNHITIIKTLSIDALVRVCIRHNLIRNYPTEPLYRYNYQKEL